jgi:hypothetical protein
LDRERISLTHRRLFRQEGGIIQTRRVFAQIRRGLLSMGRQSDIWQEGGGVAGC